MPRTNQSKSMRRQCVCSDKGITVADEETTSELMPMMAQSCSDDD